MPHGLGIFLILFVYLLIIVFVLTMLWRIAKSLHHISVFLSEIARDIRALSERSSEEKPND